MCFWNKTVYSRNVPKLVLRKPCDDLSLRPSRTAGTELNCKEMFLGIHNQARFEGFDFVVIAGGLFSLESRLIGVLVVGLDVLGHDFRLFS